MVNTRIPNLTTIMQKRKKQPTQMMVYVLQMAVILSKPFWVKTEPNGSAQLSPKSVQEDYNSRTSLKFNQDLQDFPQPASYTTILFLHSVFYLRSLRLRNIQKSTTAEAHHVTGNNSWMITLYELDKFVGLIVAHGIIGYKKHVG